MNEGEVNLARHTIYFRICETVGAAGVRLSDADLEWHYTPPCVALNWWRPPWAAPGSAFGTVGYWCDGWIEDDGGGSAYGKRSRFVPFLDLPRLLAHHSELALDLWPGDEGQMTLWKHPWRFQGTATVVSIPWVYQRHIQDSRSEFSCAKSHCIRLENGWITDRTLCYLDSGKQAIVQHTLPGRFLPDAAGLFRFRIPDEALRHVKTVLDDYETQCVLARALADESFMAHKVVGWVLECALA